MPVGVPVHTGTCVERKHRTSFRLDLTVFLDSFPPINKFYVSLNVPSNQKYFLLLIVNVHFFICGSAFSRHNHPAHLPLIGQRTTNGERYRGARVFLNRHKSAQADHQEVMGHTNTTTDVLTLKD